MIPLWVEREIERQINLVEIKKELDNKGSEKGLELKIIELPQQDNDVLDFFDYSKAAQEFFNLFKGETCYSFVEELIKVLQNDIDESDRKLKEITTKYIQFKTKEQKETEETSNCSI